MNLKRLPVYQIVLLLSFFLFRISNGLSQSTSGAKVPIEDFENIYAHWGQVLDSLKQSPAFPLNDFKVFTRFSSTRLDSLRGVFMERINTMEITLKNAREYDDTIAMELNVLYKKYLKIKNEFPSSINEFTSNKPPFLSAQCDSACNNIDFESGNLAGWNAYYAFNASTLGGTNITNITGGVAGAVTQAANDVLTSTVGFYNNTVGPSPSPDYQINITSGSRGDAIIPSIPVVSPFGGHYSVMLGDSTQVNYGVAILSQTFLVTSSNANFTYQYAVLLANPPAHGYYQQPFFRIFFINQSGDTIPLCGQYTVVSGQGTQQFDSIIYNDLSLGETYTVFYKNWTTVNVPLKKYIGQCITVVFESGDCSQGGHFGYAYVDASCSPLAILSSSQFFCGQDSISLTGPAGESGYKWTGPAGGLLSSDMARNIEIDSSGTYTLVITPVTGASCNDTLTINIGKKPGPPPNPSFVADTVCIGMATTFTNKSNPIAGGNFDWDFYNIGNYQDSATNPTWTYNLPGVYTVKLHEDVNGCGTDTLIKVVVDSLINLSFTDNSVCPKNPIAFTNTSSGAASFKWNFGDTASGSNDSSIIAAPSHIYNQSGTYTVTLIGNNHECTDTLIETVTVLPEGSRILTAPEKICSGNSTQITAGNSSRYIWNTGATTSSISVNPATTTSYYCIMTTSDGCVDTAYNTVVVNSTPTLTVCCDTSLSPGESVQLTANGIGEYTWAPDYELSCTSCDNPIASPLYTITYTVTLTSDSGCAATQLITIDVGCGSVFVPEIFSPNNDGHNDILYVRSPCIESMIFMVFDRWGNRVFESKSQDIGWDGHHNGRPMDAGTYVWRLNATMRDGTKIFKKGNVTLIR